MSRFLPLYKDGLPSLVEQTPPLARDPECKRCDLRFTAGKHICMSAAGDPGGLLTVGMYPGLHESQAGIPNVGPAGRYLHEQIQRFWQGPVAHHNAVACSPGPGEIDQKRIANGVKQCRPYVAEWIRAVKPTRILALGMPAVQSLLGRSPPINSVRRGFGWYTSADWLEHDFSEYPVSYQDPLCSRCGAWEVEVDEVSHEEVEQTKPCISVVPIIILMHPAAALRQGKFAKQAFEEDLEWALSTPDSFFAERYRFLAEGRIEIIETAEDAERIFTGYRKAVLADPTGETAITWDVENRGRLHDPKTFKLVSVATCINGSNHAAILDRHALAAGLDRYLVEALHDPRLRWVEQGQHDERVAMFLWGGGRAKGIAGDRRDLRLPRKLDDTTADGDLDSMSEMVGMGGFKAENSAEQKKILDQVKAWQPRQVQMFDDCPDPGARELLWWMLRESKRPNVKQYLFALIPTDSLSVYNGRDVVSEGLLDRIYYPKVLAQPNLRMIWEEVEGPCSRSFTVSEHWGIPISKDQCAEIIRYANAQQAALEPQLRKYCGPDLLLSSPQKIGQFIFGPKEQGGLGVPATKRTGKTNAPSTDKEAMAAVADKHPFTRLYSQYTYWDGYREKAEEFLHFLAPDGRLHPTYLVDGAESGRGSCIAAGTHIEVLRDSSKYPLGIPIEDVKVGDHVYCFDQHKKLTIRHVTWSGKTGHKAVIRIHWRGTGKQHQGYLDLTPEHRVRLVSGDYVRADELKPNDRVLAMHRGTRGGYGRLWATGHEEIGNEHRFIYGLFHGHVPDHIHHKNGNRLDNRISNLVGLSAQEHQQHHAIENRDMLSENGRKAGLRRWKENRDDMLAMVRRVADSRKLSTLFSREELQQLLEIHGYSLVRICKAGVCTFQPLKDCLIAHGFDIEDLKLKARQYEHANKIGRGFYDRGPRQYKCRNCGEPGHYATTCKNTANNHEILRIEYLPNPVDVYDLTVDGEHNFIANEICVHNCKNPNVYNLRRPEDCKVCKDKGCEECGFTGLDGETRMLRDMICAESGFEIVEVDCSQIELRGMAAVSKDRFMTEAFLNNEDLHQKAADAATLKIGRKVERSPTAKMINFGSGYDLTEMGLAKRLGIAIKLAGELQTVVLGNYVQMLARKQQEKERALKTGYAYTVWGGDQREGRHRPMWDLGSDDEYRREDALRAVWATLIQGSFSGDKVKEAHAQLVRWILLNGLEDRIQVILSIYDSIILHARTDYVQLGAYMASYFMRRVPLGYVALPDGKVVEFPQKNDGKRGPTYGRARKFKIAKTLKEALAEVRR